MSGTIYSQFDLPYPLVKISHVCFEVPAQLGFVKYVRTGINSTSIFKGLSR